MEVMKEDTKTLLLEAVSVFRKHWRAVGARIRKREKVAQRRSHAFLAGSERVRRSLATSFYSRAHVESLAAMSTEDVVEWLSPWLLAAIAYATDEDAGIDDPRKFLRSLVKSEYVAIVEYVRDRIIYPLPDESVRYGDLYASTAGASRGATVRVYKSTGEYFTPSERRSAEAGIRDNIVGTALADGDAPGRWQLMFSDENPDEIEVSVTYLE